MIIELWSGFGCYYSKFKTVWKGVNIDNMEIINLWLLENTQFIYTKIRIEFKKMVMKWIVMVTVLMLDLCLSNEI